MRRAAVTLAALLVLAGCGGESPESKSEETPKAKAEKTTEKTTEAEPTAKCIHFDKSTLRSLRDGRKKGKVTKGAAVKLAESPGFRVNYIAALKFGSGDVGLLAMGSPKAGEGLWVVADDVAREYLNWGDLATPDSPMGQAAAAAAASPQADAAKDCLG